jgi:predicted  nucleic acid-binding Zn-ribbon protein
MGSSVAGEAIWKKLRALDERMAETRAAMTGKEFTDQETFERLEKELDTMMKQRKEMAETT